MNSEDSQIPESNLSFSEAQNSQEKPLDSVDRTESKPDIKDSETPSDDWLDEQKNETSASEASESLVDNWLNELDIDRVNSSVNEDNDSLSAQLSESDSAPELSIDSSVDESKYSSATSTAELQAQVQKLQQQKEILSAEIKTLQAQKQQIFDQQLREIQENLGKMVEEGIEQLRERKNTLQREVDKLERRQERIRQEMRTNFAGASQELAIRVQGFKDYLVGSLQDLAAAAEQLQLPNLEVKTPPPSRQRQEEPTTQISSSQPQFTEQGFVEQAKRVRQLIDRYRTRPDYYGPPWQLRRTFEPIHAERVQDWFFSQGGRGAIKSMGSRLQNILVASAIISILYRIYGDRSRVLILVDTPERLGEWRRGLQDCLGISRSDFGANRGIVLFESPEVLIQRADRLVQEKLLPLVIIDETEELVNLSLLRFPLWLAFAPELQSASSGYLY
ncbi:MAG: DUF3086 domain-containing protein [Xenococcaceae cyanobacterium MO_188.B32]|nr:DUF3086 domain-containing protein [Xenococcaceae cyanobacterium MO_188.B32]